MTPHPAKSAAALVAVLLAGCAQDGTLTGLNTASINPPGTAQQTAVKANPLCLTLASQIAALNKDGIADKVAKAATKKYKMKTADLAKANELNKANAEFQAKCSNYPPPSTIVAAKPAATAANPKAAPNQGAKSAAAPKVKRNPPVPAQKPKIAAAQVPSPTAAVAPAAQPTAAQPTAAQQTAAQPTAPPPPAATSTPTQPSAQPMALPTATVVPTQMPTQP